MVWSNKAGKHCVAQVVFCMTCLLVQFWRSVGCSVVLAGISLPLLTVAAFCPMGSTRLPTYQPKHLIVVHAILRLTIFF